MVKTKLTPEEKKEKKAQQKLRAIEKKRQIKRDALEREIKFGELTIKKHEKDWKELLCKVALPRMKNELQFAWHNFERVIDCKDFTISLLMDEIHYSREQYMHNFRNHLEHLDRLITMFHERLKEMKNDNLKQVDYIKEEDSQEIKVTEAASSDGEIYIKTMLYMLDEQRKSQKLMEQVEYLSKLNEEEQKLNRIIQTLRGVLENRYMSMWEETKNFVDKYNEAISERKKEYKILKEQDDYMQQIHAEQIEKMYKLIDYSKKLKHKFSVLEITLGERIKDLQTEHKFFFDAFMSLKKKLELDRKEDFNKLTCLAQNYNSIIKYLRKASVKGSHILELATSCRKLETLKEKILPFPLNTTRDLDRTDGHRFKDSNNDWDNNNKNLKLFWQRVGQADASKYAINEECEFLKLENEILRLKIHKYCLCISCQQETLTTIPK